MACLDCPRCKGNPPLEDSETAPEEVVKRVLGRIEQLVCQHRAGTLELESIDYLERRLFEIYIAAEHAQEQLHKLRVRAILERSIIS